MNEEPFAALTPLLTVQSSCAAVAQSPVRCVEAPIAGNAVEETGRVVDNGLVGVRRVEPVPCLLEQNEDR